MIYDCVGSRESLDQAIRFATPRGRIIVLGCSAQIRKLDLTFLWSRELEIRGFLGYGTESWDGRELHTFEITRELLLRKPLPCRPIGDPHLSAGAVQGGAESGVQPAPKWCDEGGFEALRALRQAVASGSS